MSRLRLSFLLILAAVVAVWVGGAIIAAGPRLEHRALLAAIRKGEMLSDLRALNAAIADHQGALRYIPCHSSLHRALALLLANRADILMDGANVEAGDQALSDVHQALIARLQCASADGKAWLDLAAIEVHRQGIGPKAFAAYRMSATVSPGESWLAEKRLLFILPFRSVLDAASLAIIPRDIEVLSRAHPNRLAAVMKEAEVDSPEALAALFQAKKDSAY